MTSLYTPRRAARLLAAFTVLAAAACSKGDGGTAPPQPASVTNSTATTPTATVGTALTTAPTFTVKDASGNALANVAAAAGHSSAPPPARSPVRPRSARGRSARRRA